MNTIKNSVRLIGNVGQKPEVKSLEKGNKMAKISLATKEKFKDAKGGLKEETTWHNLVIWGRNAEIAEQYVDKGDKLAIEGRLTNRTYTDKDGNKKFFTEIVVNSFEMLGSPKVKSEMAAAAGDTSDDLPF